MPKQSEATGGKPLNGRPPKDVDELLRSGGDLEFGDPPPTDNPFSVNSVIHSVPEFLQFEWPQPIQIIGDWFAQGDSAIISAQRGVGKTWISMWMGICISCGHQFMGHPTTKQKVLYIDGEMQPDLTQSRLKRLCKAELDNLHLLHHQRVFNELKLSLMLSELKWQIEVTKYLVENGIKVVIIDNLSALFSGMRENNADDWNEVAGPWFLELRRRGISVVLVAHCGRNNLIRGTSKREDPLTWVMQVDENPDGDQPGRLILQTQMTKQRRGEKILKKDLSFIDCEDGTVRVEHLTNDRTADILRMIEAGLNQQEIADNINLAQGTISKICYKLNQDGLVKKKGGKWVINDPIHQDESASW